MAFLSLKQHVKALKKTKWYCCILASQCQNCLQSSNLVLKNETKNCIAYDPSSKQQMTDLRIGRDFFGFTPCQYLNMTGNLLARTDFSSPQLYIASNQLITTYNDNNHHQQTNLLLQYTPLKTYQVSKYFNTDNGMETV